MTHVTCRLTAKDLDQLWDPTLGNRVWATSSFLMEVLHFTNAAACDTLLSTLFASSGERLCNGTVSVCLSRRLIAAATRSWFAAAPARAADAVGAAA